MAIKNLISKLLEHQELSAAERSELEAFDPDGLSGELENLRSKVIESEREKLGEKERLELDIKNLSLERDQLKEAHEKLLRRQTVSELAGKNRFSDADYLDYLISRENIDLNDEAACCKFIAKLRMEKPGAFESGLKSGSGSGIASAMQNAGEQFSGGRDRIGNIISQLENASPVA